MICIYNKDESNFNTNGLAVLEPGECLFKPAINGVWQLDMRLAYDADHKSDLIENDRILKVTGLDCITEQTGAYQLFRIYDFKKEDDSVRVIAFPIGLDARFDTFTESLKLYDKTPAQAVNAINTWIASLDLDHQDYVVSLESPQYWDNTQKSSEYTRANLISILNGEKSFVQTWGGEICYDNYNIRMEHHMGTYTPVDVRYGKNILGMSYDLDASNVVTRLYPKAKSGEILNGDTRYRLTSYNYVDAPGSAVYPIPHIYAVDTPYNLVQLTDDGSAEYGESWAAYTAIRDITKFWIYNALTGTAGVDTEPLLDNIELGWLVNNYGLTMVNDKVQGVVEYFWRKVINNNTHPVLNGSVQSLIYQAMKAGFDEVLTNTQSGSYVGSTSKKMWETGFEQKFYSYTWDSAGEFRVNVLGEADYAWVYSSSKWQQLDNDGYTTGATDKTTWKWYKVKGKTYKRYGNKKKGRYLKNQWWCINDVWYKFTSGGQGIKGDALMSDCLDLIEAMEVQETTLVDSLVEAAYTAERSLLELLYNQMTDYCEVLFDTDKLAYPAINIDINFVDLSKTTEYANYEFLEKIHLGDAVNVRNDKLGIETLSERIIGLTYDVLRGCNTKIRIGLTESSVVNLLNSIGKTDNQTKYVAGDGVTIENNVISVNPPETPYLEDVLVNGTSVVRNHKAYIDLDEMGIDESVHVLFGTEEPDEDDGENNDIYVKLKPSLTPQTLILTTESIWSQISMSRNTDLTYDIELGGTSVAIDEYVSYKIQGLKEGKTYTFSFDAKFSDGTTFYPGYEEQGQLTGVAIVGITFQEQSHYYNDMPAHPNEYNEECRYMSFYRDTSQHHYENTFVATSDTMYMIAEINGVVDGHPNTLELSDLSIREYEIEKVFFKYEDDWMKAGVTANPTNPSTDTLTKIKINGVVYSVGGGGSEVSITPSLQNGTKIADYEIDGVTGSLYAPRGMTTGLAWRSLSEADYEALSTAEKNNGTIYFISDTIAETEGKTYIYISKTEYDNLTTAEKNNDIPYFIYND